MLSLPNITAICVDCVDITRADLALDISSSYCSFAETKLLTSLSGETYHNKYEIDHISNTYMYNQFMIEQLTDFIDTDFALIIQHDGFVLNPDAWEDSFLDYDYIGAPWYPGPYHKDYCVGNGGFSLRSKKLCELVTEIGYHNTEHEDVYICEHMKPILDDHNIRIAPLDIARKFSKEHGIWDGEFGFHNFSTNIDKWGGKVPLDR